MKLLVAYFWYVGYVMLYQHISVWKAKATGSIEDYSRTHSFVRNIGDVSMMCCRWQVNHMTTFDQSLNHVLHAYLILQTSIWLNIPSSDLQSLHFLLSIISTNSLTSSKRTGGSCFTLRLVVISHLILHNYLQYLSLSNNRYIYYIQFSLYF